MQSSHTKIRHILVEQGTAEDSHHELKAELNALRQREKQLTDFIERVAVPLHWVGADGTILWANEAELQLLGYTREEYVGHCITEFHVDGPTIHEILRRLHADEDVEGVEARLRCKDGSIRHVKTHSSVYRENGSFVHTRCVTTDISDHLHFSEAQERLAAIVESSDDAIISKDLNGIVQSWNSGAQRIFGYTAAEMIGQHISTIAAPEHLDEIPNILERISRGERVDHYETRRKTKDGAILRISLTVSPIRNAAGVIVGASKVARDITERKLKETMLLEANTALTRANADLQQFAYSASHDLQEPLRMVATYAEMLAKKFGETLGVKGEEYLGHILHGALRMDHLLKDLRTYTHASTSTDAPVEPISAARILETVLNDFEGAISDSEAVITHAALPDVLLHEFQLEQLFQNLISNAIRYRGATPPTIHINAEHKTNEWVFLVRDNGIGIAPQYKEQIFGIFQRLHNTAEYPGTGMGLAICERIVQRIGGRIWVESEPGRGSTFFFTVPHKPS